MFGERSGWERPLWFAHGHRERGRGVQLPARAAGTTPSGRVPRRFAAGVGVLDQTSFAKFEVSGAGAGGLSRPPVRERGPDRGRAHGADADVHGRRRDRVRRDRHAAGRGPVLRRVGGRGRGPRRGVAARRTCPTTARVRVDNVTARLGVLTLAGPNSRALLAAVTDADCSTGGVPVLPLPRDRGRDGAGPRDAGVVRGRARLRAAPSARVPAPHLRAAARRPASRSVWSTSATARWTRCGWRRPTGCGARTCRSTTRRSRPAWSGGCPSTSRFIGREPLQHVAENGGPGTEPGVPGRGCRRCRRARL